MLLTDSSDREHWQSMDERRSKQFRADIAAMEARLRTEIQLKVSESQYGVMKWLFFVYWASTVLGLAALMAALRK